MKPVIILFVLFSSFKTEEKMDSQLSNHLFKIERSKDANEIFYDISLDKLGGLSIETPINPYWRRQTEGGEIKPLTWIQQHYAYGLEFTSSTSKMAKFHFVSYNKKNFTLKKDKAGEFKVFTVKDKREVIVNRIFIQIDGGTFWFPTISRVELHTTDPLTNTEEVEIINP